MSSVMVHKRRVEAWLVAMACVGFTLWYAKGQLLFTLYFGYQLARALFPQWLPGAAR